MGRLHYSMRLAKELGQFIFKRKIFWLIPILILLLPLALMIAGSEVIMPLIYTIF
jgi:hypothetical protein